MQSGHVSTLVGLDKFKTIIKPRPADTRRVLGMDLGRKCGVAVVDVPEQPGDAAMLAGIWDLHTGPHDSGPIKFLRLQAFLKETSPDLIVYEDVKYTPPHMPDRLTPAAIIARAATPMEFLGGLRATMTTWAETHGIPTQGFGISEIKQWATGKGNASKLQMIKAANTKYGFTLEETEESEDNNVADAIHCCAMGVHYYQHGLWPSPQAKKKGKHAEQSPAS